MRLNVFHIFTGHLHSSQHCLLCSSSFTGYKLKVCGSNKNPGCLRRTSICRRSLWSLYTDKDTGWKTHELSLIFLYRDRLTTNSENPETKYFLWAQTLVLQEFLLYIGFRWKESELWFPHIPHFRTWESCKKEPLTQRQFCISVPCNHISGHSHKNLSYIWLDWTLTN